MLLGARHVPSVSAVAVSTWGAITSVRPLNNFHKTLTPGQLSKSSKTLGSHFLARHEIALVCDESKTLNSSEEISGFVVIHKIDWIRIRLYIRHRLFHLLVCLAALWQHWPHRQQCWQLQNAMSDCIIMQLLSNHACLMCSLYSRFFNWTCRYSVVQRPWFCVLVFLYQSSFVFVAFCQHTFGKTSTI